MRQPALDHGDNLERVADRLGRENGIRREHLYPVTFYRQTKAGRTSLDVALLTVAGGEIPGAGEAALSPGANFPCRSNHG